MALLRKPAATPAKPRRITRARSGDADTTTTVAKASKRAVSKPDPVPKTAKAQAMESKSRVTKRSAPTTTNTVKSGRATTRSTKNSSLLEPDDASDDEPEAQVEIAVTKPPIKPTRASRTAPASAVTSGLAAAPRRRIKVTPLVNDDQPDQTAAPVLEEKPVKKSSARTKKEIGSTASNPSTTRAERTVAAADLNAQPVTEPTEREIKKRGRTIRAAKSEEEAQPTTTPKPAPTSTKARGRPKMEKVAVDPVEKSKLEPVAPRQTRARTASVASSVVPDRISVVVPKKRVTFEPLPGDDEEKENKRPKVMAKTKTTKASTIAKKAEATATGMRAKPIRKPAPIRTTKATRGASAKASAPTVDEMEIDEPEKRMPQALTPKKITQVAKAPSMDSDREEEEDELAGAKTPVRNLSLSPRRGLTPSAACPLFPVKILDFATALRPTSPSNAGQGVGLSITSPPRRMPTSPLKDSLKESPRRAPEGVTIFRSQVPDASVASSRALNPPNVQSLLQQSPKRVLGDSMVFPPSAVKSRATPLKNSVLFSPARRHFSASRQKTPARVSPSPRKLSQKENVAILAEVEEFTSSDHEEVAVSSHFRSSVSPQRSARVYRLSKDELAMETGAEVNFDESVLDARSPFKVDKVKPVVADTAASIPEPAPQGGLDALLEETDNEIEMETPADSFDDQESTLKENDETITDPALESEEVSDDEEEALNGVALHQISAEEPMSDVAEDEHSASKLRTPDVLFNRMRQVDDESEDELAGDQTPDNRMIRPSSRHSMSTANIRSRLSNGIVPQGASRNLGFTPLAAQVQGWRGASPEKRTPASHLRSQGLFSPVARVHVEGAVELNRPDTPGSKRKSLGGRRSLAPSVVESPVKPDFFAEGMAAQDFEEQVEENEQFALEQQEDMHDSIEQQTHEAVARSAVLYRAESMEEEDDRPKGDCVELTTDLVAFTNASETAIVDFEALAHEAEELAHEENIERGITVQIADSTPVLKTVNEDLSIVSGSAASSGDDQESVTEADQEDEEIPTVLVSEVVEEEHSMLSTSSGSFEDENQAPIEQIMEERASVQEVEEIAESDIEEDRTYEADDTILYAHELTNMITIPATTQATQAASAYPSMTTPSIEVSPFRYPTAVSEMDFTVTPIRPDVSATRQIQTVVSKVPLRPEGIAESLLMPRKRARSLSISASTPLGKRRSLGFDFQRQDEVVTPRAHAASPQRRVRSAAPSPAHSLASGITTPGQMSFVIDDFGDSTLDGIEMPEDEDEIMSDEMENEETGLDESIVSVGSNLFKTPVASASARRRSHAPSSVRSNGTATPSYAMSTKSSTSRLEATPRATPSKSAVSKTPATATATKAKTPSTLLKSKMAKTPQTSRTPLRSVGSGILHGAVVHTDIHTSEGMDASAFYLDSLISLGARVVKEWRWNSRAGVAQAGHESPTQTLSLNDAPGITHVVYKDGGKRTLEKVRAAKGQVLCVGVGWVLDCMREGKWLDESAYAVDQTILPRGGSRRRKSMEPRMLVNENGSLSAQKEPRGRSVSVGDFSGMSSDLKLELINTPVRGREILEGEDGREVTQVSEETEISSTYNSPTAATIGGGGDTANVGLLMAERDAMRTPGSVMSRRRVNVDVSTPQSTSLAVDYDPRTAATPLTPYLVAKGRDLIQKSAPPKQVNKGIFDQDEDDSMLGQKENQRDAGKKFQVKGGKKVFDGRRKTLGVPGVAFKPVVSSPLRKE